jgi:predicted dehydrogenase
MNRMARRDFLRQSALGAGVAAAWAAAADARDAKPRRIRVAQIGTGHSHAGGKIDALRRLADDYEVVGIAEPDPDRRRAAENSPAYRGLPWMTEAQLLETPGLKVVAVETEVPQLVPTARRCIAAGAHVHVDKPPGENLADFKRLLDEAAARRLCVQMGYMFRANPALRLCFQAVRQGWLGRVFEVHGVMSKMADAEERRRNLPYRGAMMFELGCHLIDALATVLGRPTNVVGYRRSLRPQIDSLADNALAVFEYPAALATIRVSVTEVEGGQRRQFVVCGTQGTAEIRPLEPPRLCLSLDRPREKFAKGRHEIALARMPGRYDDQLRELARIVRGEIEPPYTPAHDLLVQELVLRASNLPTRQAAAAGGSGMRDEGQNAARFAGIRNP